MSRHIKPNPSPWRAGQCECCQDSLSETHLCGPEQSQEFLWAVNLLRPVNKVLTTLSAIFDNRSWCKLTTFQCSSIHLRMIRRSAFNLFQPASQLSLSCRCSSERSNRNTAAFMTQTWEAATRRRRQWCRLERLVTRPFLDAVGGRVQRFVRPRIYVRLCRPHEKTRPWWWYRKSSPR